MTDKEKQVVTKPNDTGLVDNQTQVTTDIRKHHAAIKLALKLKGKDEDSYDLTKEMDAQSKEAKDLFLSLGANDALKTMLVAQMAAIHDLQQDAYYFAKGSRSPDTIRHHINCAAKLSNVFIQQATVLQKLQGKGQQRVTVEHVHVHDGGQAIVGNVETSAGGGVKGGREKT